MSEFAGDNFGIKTEYDGVIYDSATEAAWAAYFDLTNQDAAPQPLTFDFNDNPDKASNLYTPDFFLPHVDTFVEVKIRQNVTSGATKLALLASLTGSPGLLVDGKPHNATWYLFSPSSSDSVPISDHKNHHANFSWSSYQLLVNREQILPHLRDELVQALLEADKSWHPAHTLGAVAVMAKDIRRNNRDNPVQLKLPKQR